MGRRSPPSPRSDVGKSGELTVSIRTYRIRLAAEMSGVPEGLIRAWERRYGVLKPRRTASGYRAYTETDIDVLRRLKKLTAEGISIADASKMLPAIKRESKAAQPGEHQPRAPLKAQIVKWQQEILVAAERMDQQAIEQVLDQSIASMPPVAFFEEVLIPLQREIGERWHAGRVSIAEEHLVTQAVKQRVMALIHNAPRRAKRHAVLACFPLEDHELGLMGAALKFRHAGWRVTFLGARTPVEHLARVVSGVRPDVVALSCVNDVGVHALLDTLHAIADALPAQTHWVVGGLTAFLHADAVRSVTKLAPSTEAEWETLLD